MASDLEYYRFTFLDLDQLCVADAADNNIVISSPEQRVFTGYMNGELRQLSIDYSESSGDVTVSTTTEEHSSMSEDSRSIREDVEDNNIGSDLDDTTPVKDTDDKVMGLVQIDEKLIDSILADLVDNVTIRDSLQMKPRCLPAYIVFMVLRYADRIEDDNLLIQWFYKFLEHLRTRTDHPKCQGDMEIQIVWLANTLCLYQLVRQYSCESEREYKLHENRINYDMRTANEDLHVAFSVVYKNLLDIVAQLVKPKAVGAVLEHEGFGNGIDKGGNNGWLASSNPATIKHALPSLIGQLEMVVDKCRQHELPEFVLQLIMKQAFSWISTTVLNTLMLKSDCCNWNKATQIRFNLNTLEAWLSDQSISNQTFAPLLPIKQAAQMLMHRKTMLDVNSLADIPINMQTNQITKILNMYRPMEGEEPIDPNFVRAVELRLHEIRDETGDEIEAVIQSASNYSLEPPFTLDNTSLAAIEVPPNLYHVTKI